MLEPDPILIQSPDSSLFCRVRGRVQGVGFRYFVQHTARQLGLRGWVRNAPDGSVELHARGPREKLEDLARAVRRGPTAARVTGCEERWDALPAETGQQFTIR